MHIRKGFMRSNMAVLPHWFFQLLVVWARPLLLLTNICGQPVVHKAKHPLHQSYGLATMCFKFFLAQVIYYAYSWL